MVNGINLFDVLQGNSDINLLFDDTRLIDLSNHTEFKCVDYDLIKTSKRCYCKWDNKTTCKNCISRQAFIEERPMTKLQYVNNKIQLIMAIPTTIDDKKYVLELIKDITDSLVVNDAFHPDNTDIHNIINELNEIAVMDPFTNLYNKKFINKQMIEDIHLAKKNKKDYVIVLFDIDNFKWVNDTYGHVNGDLAIQELVQCIHKHTDNLNCWAARYGGDEFLLAFRNMSKEVVTTICDKIQEEIGKKIFEVDLERYSITTTYGIYECNPMLDDYESMLRQVDGNMYGKKRKR